MPLPDFGKIELDQSSYIDENGISFPSEDLKGKILLVNYLSVVCPQSCPLKFNLFKFYL